MIIIATKVPNSSSPRCGQRSLSRGQEAFWISPSACSISSWRTSRTLPIRQKEYNAPSQSIWRLAAGLFQDVFDDVRNGEPWAIAIRQFNVDGDGPDAL